MKWCRKEGTKIQLLLLVLVIGVAARLLAIEAKLLLCLSGALDFFWVTLDNCVLRFLISDCTVHNNNKEEPLKKGSSIPTKRVHYNMCFVQRCLNSTGVLTFSCSSCSLCAFCWYCCLVLKSRSFSDASALSWHICSDSKTINSQQGLKCNYAYLFVFLHKSLILLCDLLL